MRKLECHTTSKLIVASLDEGLDERRAAVLQEHIDRCPACRLAMEETRRVLDLVAVDVPADPGEDFWKRYRMSLDAKIEEVEVSREWGFTWKALGAAAAAILVVIALYGGIYGPAQRGIGDGNQALAVLENLSPLFGPDSEEEPSSPADQELTSGALAARQPMMAYDYLATDWFDVEDDPDTLFL